jgi:hypothetical protein
VLGQHSRDVLLGRLAIGEAALADLVARGIVGVAAPMPGSIRASRQSDGNAG